MEAVDHVWVLTLARNQARMSHMRSLLQETLNISTDRVTWLHGVDCREWGRWPALQHRQPQDAAPDWWLPRRVCADDEAARGGSEPPGCLQTRYRSCIGTTAPPPPVCNELCYTMSVVAALDALLRSPFERALLIEDDVCATSVLHSASSVASLRWLHGHSDEWDLVKLGDCYRAGHSGRSSSRLRDVLATGTCARAFHSTASGRAYVSRLPNNSLLPTLPPAMCTHAMAVSRRFARHLVSQSFPATDVFDGLLISHIARQRSSRGSAAQQGGFRLRSVDQALFAQVGKVSPRGFAGELGSISHVHDHR